MKRRLFNNVPAGVPATVCGAGTTCRTFRFAQITDIHFSPNNPNPTEDLLRSVAQINATDSIDFVLVTGDITEEGDRATMLKKSKRHWISTLKVKYYVVLGNHETKWSDSGCTAFGEIFGGERFEFEHKGILFLGFNSGPLMRMAYGHVVPQDIRWMTEDNGPYSVGNSSGQTGYTRHTLSVDWTAMWITGMK
ncbi:MAG: metallophosphoesterase family protein [Bacteroides stercoris]